MSGKKLNNIPKVIAEIASAHNGSLKILKKLSNTAIKAKSDYLKFQIFKNKNLCHESSKYFKGLSKIEIPFKEWSSIIKKYRKRIKIILEPFDEESYQFCKKFKRDVFLKISSSEQDNYIMIQDAFKNFKKVFINISGYSIKEINNIFGRHNKKNIILIYGYQNFPTNLNKIRLGLIKKLGKSKFTTGYADHTDSSNFKLTYLACTTAIMNGAKFIEKHITLKRKNKLPDYISSFEEKEFVEFASYIQNLFKISNYDKISKDEKKYEFEMGKHAVLKKNIEIDEIILEKNLSFLRTSKNGLKRKDLFKFTNLKKIRAKKNLKKNQVLDKSNIKISF